MKRLTSGVAILAAVFALAPLQVQAQQGQRGGRGGPPQQAGRMGRAQAPGMGAGRGGGIEGIMRMRERLQLTDDQVRRLEALRAETVARRTAHQARMADLRSRVVAGEATPGTLVDSAAAWRKNAVAVRQQERERVEAVLNDAQKDTLQSLMQRRRAFAAGRAGARRGVRQGMRGGGGGFLPGRQFRMQRPGGMTGGMMPGRMMRPGARGGAGPGMGFGPPPLPRDSVPATGGGR